MFLLAKCSYSFVCVLYVYGTEWSDSNKQLIDWLILLYLLKEHLTLCYHCHYIRSSSSSSTVCFKGISNISDDRRICI